MKPKNTEDKWLKAERKDGFPIKEKQIERYLSLVTVKAKRYWNEIFKVQIKNRQLMIPRKVIKNEKMTAF